MCEGPWRRQPCAEACGPIATVTDLRRDDSSEMLHDGSLLGVLLEGGVEAAEEGVDGTPQATACHVQVQVEEERKEHGTHVPAQRCLCL